MPPRSAVAAESPLPEQQERLADLVRMRVDVLAVGAGRFVQREPGQRDRQEHEDVADAVGDGDAGRRIPALAADRVEVREVFTVECPPQIDVGPAQATFLSAQRRGEIAQTSVLRESISSSDAARPLISSARSRVVAGRGRYATGVRAQLADRHRVGRR